MLLCTWLFTVHVHCIDWTNNLVYENKSEDRTINMFNQSLINVLFLKILIMFPKY